MGAGFSSLLLQLASGILYPGAKMWWQLQFYIFVSEHTTSFSGIGKKPY